MIGGFIKLFLDKYNEKKNKQTGSGGILFCSGMIAGEGLVGILLAVISVLGVLEAVNLSGVVNFGWVGGVIVLLIIAGLVLFFSARDKKDAKDAKEE